MPASDKALAISANPRKPVRERSNRRIALQSQQKQDSRARILTAMGDILHEIPYALVAVEDIILHAKISRATFYRHFASKFAVGKALHDEFWPRLFELYSGLISLRNPSDRALGKCLKSMSDYYRANMALATALRQMMVIEPEFEPIADKISGDIIEKIISAAPGHRLIEKGSPRDRSVRIEARLFLQQLDEFCYASAAQTWLAGERDIEAGIQIMVRNFRRLLQDLDSAS